MLPCTLKSILRFSWQHKQQLDEPLHRNIVFVEPLMRIISQLNVPISYTIKMTLQKKRVIPAQAYRRFGPKRLYETHTGVFTQSAYMKTPINLARSSRLFSRVSISAFWV